MLDAVRTFCMEDIFIPVLVYDSSCTWILMGGRVFNRKACIDIIAEIPYNMLS